MQNLTTLKQAIHAGAAAQKAMSAYEELHFNSGGTLRELESTAAYQKERAIYLSAVDLAEEAQSANIEGISALCSGCGFIY